MALTEDIAATSDLAGRRNDLATRSTSSNVGLGVPGSPASYDAAVRSARAQGEEVDESAGDDNTAILLSARGAFYRVVLNTQNGSGIYAIDGLTNLGTEDGDSRQLDPDDPDANLAIEDRKNNSRFRSEQQTALDATQSESPILITGVEFNQSDITSQVACLNNAKVFYSYGQNFGQVMIAGEVLLGPLGNISEQGIRRVADYFWTSRVSNRKLPVRVSVGTTPYFVYLTGMKMARIDENYHILPFVLLGTLLDLEREDASKINANSVVLTGGEVGTPSLFAALTVRNPKPLVLEPGGKATNDATAAELKAEGKVSQANDPPPKTKDAPTSKAGRPGTASAVIANKKSLGLPLTPEEKMLDSMNRRVKELQTQDPDTAREFLEETNNIRQQLNTSILQQANGKMDSQGNLVSRSLSGEKLSAFQEQIDRNATQYSSQAQVNSVNQSLAAGTYNALGSVGEFRDGVGDSVIYGYKVGTQWLGNAAGGSGRARVNEGATAAQDSNIQAGAGEDLAGVAPPATRPLTVPAR
jgi:hypothetical protein